MSTKQNKAILKRLFSEFNKGNFDVIDELFAEDFVDRHPPPGATPTKEGLKQWLISMQKTLPDLHLSLEDVIAEGDKVSYRFTTQGTDKGGFMGLPATGKKVSAGNVGMLRFANRKVVERWTIGDYMTPLRELGLL